MKNLWILSISAAVMGAIAFIPVRIAITLHRVPEPQAILVLGGNPKRTYFASQFWRSHPQLDIWMSDEAVNLVYNNNVLNLIGKVPQKHIHHDVCATDTVTNFTCVVRDFLDRKIWHLYLITSDYHMARSRAIATLVLGSRGIVITPVSVPSTTDRQPESLGRILRDCGRSVLWMVTGRTGARLNPKLRREA